MLHQIGKSVDFPFFKNRKDKVRNVPSLLKRIGTLMKEGYTFSDALFMLLPYHVDDPEKWNGMMQQQFNSGSRVSDILKYFPIPKHFLLLTNIAEEKGELAESLHHISGQMEFQREMARKVAKLLAYPFFLITILAIVFVIFRNYFLPNMQQIATSTNSAGIASLKLAMVLLHFPDFLIAATVVGVVSTIGMIHYIRKRDIAEQLNMLLKIPVVNYVYKLHLTRQFSHLLGSLLLSGISLQHALSILEEQEMSRHVSYVAALLKHRVIFGDSLGEAVKILGLFTPKFDEFIKHGERSGHLGREMLIFSELLDGKIQSMLKTCMATIQPLFFILIALCIVAAYISMLLPVYDLVEIM